MTESEGGEEEHMTDEEGVDNDDEDTWPADKRAAGKRIFVLSLQGEMLQIYMVPDSRVVIQMALSQRKLLVLCRTYGPGHTVVALKGV